MIKSYSLNWEMAIEIYMFHLNMSRAQACSALGINYREKSNDLGKKNMKKQGSA